MTMPRVPSDPGVKGIRLQHPTDPTKIIQLELADTGTIIDGIEVWRLTTGGPGGPSPSLPSVIPANPPIAITGVAQQLPATALVSGIVLKAPSTNAASIWVGRDNTVAINNGYELEPGEPLSLAGTNLDLFWVIGTLGDVLHRIGG